nr:neuronal growth regulator 1-like [Cherax quadricarinatus]
MDKVQVQNFSDEKCLRQRLPNIIGIINMVIIVTVAVPPVIDDVSSSSDVTVDEGSDVVMTCEARGDPHPVIRWVREDGRRFNLNFSSTVEEQVGRSLKLWSVSHNTSGAFLCIATNGVPPSVSKRILLTVNSAPRIVQEGESGRVGAPAEGVATLICSFHARPLAEVRWDRGPRQVKVHGPGVTIDTTSDQETGLWRSVLTVHMKKASDFGQYRCLVRNRLGTDQVFFHVTAVETTTSVSPKRFIPRQGRVSWESTLRTSSDKRPSALDRILDSLPSILPNHSNLLAESPIFDTDFEFLMESK